MTGGGPATPGEKDGAPGDAELAGLSYEEIVSLLETTIEQMSAGDLGIEEVTDLYERAGRLHELAAQRLERIRDRIEHLTADDPGA